jgi:regulatory protein
MRIISIAKKQVTKNAKPKDRYEVAFDNGEKIDVSVEQIADIGIFTGRDYTDEEYAELCEKIMTNISKVRAVNMIGYRNLSVRELKQRLMAKGDSDENAERTAEWLQEIGLLDDEKYAASIVEYYSERGYGMAKVKQELYRRGIPQEVQEAVLADVEYTDDEAIRFLEKKLKGSVAPEDLQKATQTLVRRGFSYDEAHSAVNKYREINDIEA